MIKTRALKYENICKNYLDGLPAFLLSKSLKLQKIYVVNKAFDPGSKTCI